VKTRIIATAVVAGALVLGAQTSAFAADYTGDVTATTAAPGATISYFSDDTDEAPFTSGTASLTGTLALEEAVITPASTLNTTVTTDANGNLGFTVKLPTSAPAGSVYTLAVEVGEFNDVKTLTIAGVPADTAGNASGALPSTGVDATPYVWFGGGLLLLGAGLVSVLAFVRRSSKTA
jgi:LPXTG-motif cell wall-anchored protein